MCIYVSDKVLCILKNVCCKVLKYFLDFFIPKAITAYYNKIIVKVARLIQSRNKFIEQYSNKIILYDIIKTNTLPTNCVPLNLRR